MHSADTVCILYDVSQLTEITYNIMLLQVGKSYMNAREALIVNGNFLLTHFKRMDTAAGGKATFAFSSTPFTAALKEEVKPRSLSAGLCSTSGIDKACRLCSTCAVNTRVGILRFACTTSGLFWTSPVKLFMSHHMGTQT